jgi:basic membrane protein A
MAASYGGRILMNAFTCLLGSTIAAALIASGAAARADTTNPLIIYVTSHPLGVDDFLKLGDAGTKRAAKELNGRSKTYESVDPTTQRQNLTAAAKAGADVVIAISFEFDDILPDVAAAFPKTKFLDIDSCPSKSLPNIYCVRFREQEMNYLAGAEAALTSKTGKIGAIGALDIPFIHRWTDPFAEGAKHVRPDIQVAPTLWIGGANPFSDPARGQQTATAMLASGVDRIMAAASASNGGMFRAMRDVPGALAFGVDVNQCPQAPGVVLDNVEKEVDVAVVAGVKAVLQGNAPQTNVLGLKEGALTLTGLKPGVEGSKCEIAKFPDVIAQVRQLREQIVDGTIKVTDPLAH